MGIRPIVDPTSQLPLQTTDSEFGGGTHLETQGACKVGPLIALSMANRIDASFSAGDEQRSSSFELPANFVVQAISWAAVLAATIAAATVRIKISNLATGAGEDQLMVNSAGAGTSINLVTNPSGVIYRENIDAGGVGVKVLAPPVRSDWLAAFNLVEPLDTVGGPALGPNGASGSAFFRGPMGPGTTGTGVVAISVQIHGYFVDTWGAKLPQGTG